MLRPEHKFQKKPLPGGHSKLSKREAARKHRRAVANAQAEADGVGDGMAIQMGRKGGIVRPTANKLAAAVRL